MVKEALQHLEERKRARVAEKKDGEYEVLLIDDGSTDGTAQVGLELAKELKGQGGENIRVVKLERNRGKGGAVIHVSSIAILTDLG